MNPVGYVSITALFVSFACNNVEMSDVMSNLGTGATGDKTLSGSDSGGTLFTTERRRQS